MLYQNEVRLAIKVFFKTFFLLLDKGIFLLVNQVGLVNFLVSHEPPAQVPGTIAENTGLNPLQ